MVGGLEVEGPGDCWQRLFGEGSGEGVEEADE